MRELLDYAPIAAAAFAIPQFLPQILKLRATDDTAGVSWSWATLTSVNNAAWIAYFASLGYWTALVPSSSATILAGTLATMLAARGEARVRPAVLISTWASLLTLVFLVAGRSGLGTVLTAAFILQVTPSISSAYRTDQPTGISRGTWLLIFSELSCWTVFGTYKSDPRLMILGASGVTASILMLARENRTGWRGTTSTRSSPRPMRARREKGDELGRGKLRLFRLLVAGVLATAAGAGATTAPDGSRTGLRRLSGRYFWKTVRGPRSMCRLEVRAAGRQPVFRPVVAVQLLITPSLGCGRVHRYTLEGR